MAERLDGLIHWFEFSEENRAQLVFSDASKIRLDPKLNVVELKQQSDGYYPTDSDIYVISPLFQPTAVRLWDMLQVFIQHKAFGGEFTTQDGFRLHDGTNQYWWNGTDWVVNTSNWNSEDEVAVNIVDFPTTARKLRIVVNLKTLDPAVTPSLSLIKLGWKAKIHYLEDMIYRTLAPNLRGLRFMTDFAFNGGGSTSLNVGAALDAAGIGFNQVDVDSVFNHSDDPGRLTNLLVSYNPGTRIATLSSSIPTNEKALVQLLVEPEVSVLMTDPDFIEVEKSPALIVTEIETPSSGPLSQDDGIVVKATGAARRVKAPYQFNLDFQLQMAAPGAVDLARMTEAVTRHLEENPLIRTAALDRSYRWWLKNEFTTITKANRTGLHVAQASFSIQNVLAFLKPAVDEIGVMNVGLTLTKATPATDSEPITLGDRAMYFQWNAPSEDDEFEVTIPGLGMPGALYFVGGEINDLADGPYVPFYVPRDTRTSTTFIVKFATDVPEGYGVEFHVRPA